MGGLAPGCQRIALATGRCFVQTALAAGKAPTALRFMHRHGTRRVGDASHWPPGAASCTPHWRPGKRRPPYGSCIATAPVGWATHHVGHRTQHRAHRIRRPEKRRPPYGSCIATAPVGWATHHVGHRTQHRAHRIGGRKSADRPTVHRHGTRRVGDAERWPPGAASCKPHWRPGRRRPPYDSSPRHP